MSDVQAQWDSRYIAAVQRGDAAAVVEALDAGADVNAGDCLHDAIGNKDMRMASLLLGRGIDLPDNALYTAVQGKHPQMVRLLAASGADVNYRDAQTGKHPLHLAASIGHPEMCAVLLDYGADTSLLGESVIGPADALAIAEDGIASHPGMGQHRLAADVIRAYVEAEELPLPDRCDRKTMMFEGEGYRALLDQPRVWHRFGPVAEQMERHGEPPLTKEDLLQENAAGKSWLQRAVECGAAKTVMPYLQRQGAQLTSRDLLDEGGEPNPLLKALTDHYALHTVFSLENCRGQGSAEMENLYRALPPEGRDQVTNYRSLRVQLQQQERATSPRQGR